MAEDIATLAALDRLEHEVGELRSVMIKKLGAWRELADYMATHPEAVRRMLGRPTEGPNA